LRTVVLAHPSGSKLHPQPLALWERGAGKDFKVPLPRERDLG